MMADQRTMAELLRAPTEGYAEAIVVPLILAEQFELKHSLITMMTSDQFFELEKDNQHDHIRWFNKITSTIKYKDVPNSAIKLMLFPFSLARAACRTTNLRNEISNFQQRFNESFHEAWDRYKDLLHACPHYGFTELHQLDTFYNALNPVDKDSLNAVAGGNLLERRTQDVLTIIETKFKQTSAMTIAMMAMLKQFQATPPPASVKAVEETCVTCGGAHPYYHYLAVGGNNFLELRDNIQGYILAVVVNYNQGNPGYRPPAPTQQNQNVHLNELEKVRRMNEANMKAMQTQIDMVKNKLRNEMKNSIQASLSNQTNEIKNMMAGLFQKKSASTSGSGSLPSNTVANPKGELKPITTRSGSVPDGPTVPTPTSFINPKEDERVEEILTDPNLTEYTSKSDPRVPLILGRPFLRTARALIYVHGEEMILLESDAENVYDDPFDSKGEKIKESKLLIDELDLPCDFLPFEYDWFISQDFSRVDALPLTNNEDKIFNLGILIQEKFFEIITHVVQDKKLAISNASLVLEDFDPPFYEPFFFKEVPKSKMQLLFSSKNKEKVFKPGIHTFENVHSSCISELSHPGYKIFKINHIFKSLMKIFLFFYGKDTYTLAVPCLHFYPL
nr:hypothetical protein [Tanacetum cinerariifolium]